MLHFCGGVDMPTKNPRINVVLERPIFTVIKKLAARDHVSLSMKVRDLIIEALESSEDVLLTKIAEEREKNFDRKIALTHKQITSF